MDISWAIVIVIILFISLYIYHSNSYQHINIPGPIGYPLIGNVLDMDIKRLHLKLYEWSKTYGDIFKITLLGQVCVVVNSSSTMRELFSKEPNATLTSARPQTFIRNYLMSNSDVAFRSVDDVWVKQRKLMYQLVHAYGEGLRNWGEGINRKLSELREEICRSEHLSCDPQDIVDDFVMCTIQTLLVGRYSERRSEFHKYLFEIDEKGNVFANPGVDTLYNNLPFLRFLPLPPSKALNRVVELRDGLLPFLEKQSVDDDAGMYNLMKKLLEDEEPWLTKTMMEAMILDIIGAGFLTTRGMLLAIIRILLSSPEVQSKLQEEVDTVIGNKREPTLQDRSNMPYIEAVILETLRFISHVPISILHSVSDDVEFGNITIPKDTVIIPNLWSMHHNENEWKDPFRFIPERFLTEDGQIKPANDNTRKQFMGFGFGKRSCVGEVFAKSRIFLFLSTLMQVCTVKSPAGEKMPMLNPRDMAPGIIVHPFPYKCKFVKRNETVK